MTPSKRRLASNQQEAAGRISGAWDLIDLIAGEALSFFRGLRPLGEQGQGASRKEWRRPGQKLSQRRTGARSHHLNIKG